MLKKDVVCYWVTTTVCSMQCRASMNAALGFHLKQIGHKIITGKYDDNRHVEQALCNM